MPWQGRSAAAALLCKKAALSALHVAGAGRSYAALEVDHSGNTSKAQCCTQQTAWRTQQPCPPPRGSSRRFFWVAIGDQGCWEAPGCSGDRYRAALRPVLSAREGVFRSSRPPAAASRGAYHELPLIKRHHQAPKLLTGDTRASSLGVEASLASGAQFRGALILHASPCSRTFDIAFGESCKESHPSPVS